VISDILKAVEKNLHLEGFFVWKNVVDSLRRSINGKRMVCITHVFRI